MLWVYVSRIHTIECVRDSSGRVSATITRFGIIYYKKEVIPAGELLRAELEVESSEDIEGQSVTYHRVRLITIKYTTFLSNVKFSDYDKASSRVEQINYFIQESTQKSMSITQDDRPIGYIFGGIFGIIALIILLTSIRG